MDMQLSERAVLADEDLRIENTIVEVSVLLETRQLMALETAARAHGVTTGELVRCLLRDYLASFEDNSAGTGPRSGTLKHDYATTYPSHTASGGGK